MNFTDDDILNQDAGSKISLTNRDITDGVSLVDADTVYDNVNNQSVRIGGINSLETSKNLNGQFKYGDVAGNYASDASLKLAKDNGFTQITTTGEKDDYGRAIGDLINPDTGERYSTKMLQAGLADTTMFSDRGQQAASIGGRLDRLQREQAGEQTDWDLAKNNLNAILSADGLEAKPIAINEAEYAIAPDIFSGSGTQIRDKGRTIDNYSKGGWGKIKTAFGLGASGVIEGYYGSFDLIGDVFGNDTNWGQANAERIKRELADLPVLRNQNAFDEDGNWTLDSAGKITDYIFTNMATSAPYMIQAIISTALAAPTLGLSLAFPAITYTGQTYNEQEDKNAGTAIVSGIGQSALEYFGVKLPGLIGAKSFLTNPKIRPTVIKEIAKKMYGGNTKKAEAALSNYSLRQIASISKAAKSQLGKQLKAKHLAKQSALAAGGGGLSEGITEVGQEFLGALGAKNFDYGAIDKGELQNRLLNAAVAGFGLGSVTNVGGPIGQSVQTADAYYNRAPDVDKFSQDLKYQEELKKQGKGYENINTYLDEADDFQDSAPTVKELAKDTKDAHEKLDFIGKSRKFLAKGLNQFWEGDSANINRRFGSKGQYTRAAIGSLGGNKAHHGSDLETDQHLKQASLQNTVGTEASALEFFGARKLEDINRIYQDSKVKDFVGRITDLYENNPGKYKSFLDVVRKQKLTLDGKHANIADKIAVFAEKGNAFDRKEAELSGKPKKRMGLFNSRVVDKRYLQKNQQEFIDNAVADGFTREEATGIVNDFLDLPNLSEIDDVFDPFLRTAQVNTSTVKKDLTKLANNPKNSAFFNKDIFYNVAARSGTAAAKASNERYLGQDGKKQGYLIQQAVKEGELTQAEASELASEIQDIMEIRAGEYKRIESSTWRAINNNLMFVSTLNALPLAQTASVVELALVTKSINNQGIFTTLGKFAKEAGREMFSEVNALGSKVTGGRIQRKAYEGGGRGKLIEQGFLAESQSQTRRHDISASESQQKYLNAFFRMTGLAGITNATRSMRLGLAGDAIRGWIDEVSFESHSGPTQASVEAREHLINLGVDVDFMVKQHVNGAPMTDGEAKHFDENLQRATYNFVNDAVANPTKTNRPKFYQNPRTRLFFQFQGFLATLTATILPKLYKATVTGTVANRINAISTLGTLIALGFLSSFLKDQLKYGEETPYLDDWGKLQRAVGASGVLGTGERILNILHPLYPQQHDNWVELALDAIQSEAPALGYAGKLVDLTGAVYEGDPGTIGKKAVKAAPVFGPFNELSNKVEDILE